MKDDQDSFPDVRFAVDPGLADSIAEAEERGEQDPRHEFAQKGASPDDELPSTP